MTTPFDDKLSLTDIHNEILENLRRVRNKHFNSDAGVKIDDYDVRAVMFNLERYRSLCALLLDTARGVT